MAVRPMSCKDLPAVLELQHLGYPAALWDSAEAFESRIRLWPATNLVLEDGGGVVAYLVSHPWTSRSPPPVDAVLAALSQPPDCWFIHDLSVAAHRRGGGLAAELFAAGRAAAAALGLTGAELIAVDGAQPFWRRLGFAPTAADHVLADKMDGYGAGAVYMTRTL